MFADVTVTCFGLTLAGTDAALNQNDMTGSIPQTRLDWAGDLSCRTPKSIWGRPHPQEVYSWRDHGHARDHHILAAVSFVTRSNGTQLIVHHIYTSSGLNVYILSSIQISTCYYQAKMAFAGGKYAGPDTPKLNSGYSITCLIITKTGWCCVTRLPSEPFLMPFDTVFCVIPIQSKLSCTKWIQRDHCTNSSTKWKGDWIGNITHWQANIFVSKFFSVKIDQ